MTDFVEMRNAYHRALGKPEITDPVLLSYSQYRDCFLNPAPGQDKVHAWRTTLKKITSLSLRNYPK